MLAQILGDYFLYLRSKQYQISKFLFSSFVNLLLLFSPSNTGACILSLSLSASGALLHKSGWPYLVDQPNFDQIQIWPILLDFILFFFLENKLLQTNN